ncbi:MAG: UDP-glucuronate 4-epimerase [Gaiellales bacterium]|jgi:nucleoside-diphosphate-sugar epimerase|nr:UDP-glucuronate 4-epimerase [Gaiellales bacterium]
MTPCVLVTGAHGCIGAWVVRELVERGERVVTLDQGSDASRLRLVLDPGPVAALDHEMADITDLEAFERVLDAHRISHVIHLAALQVPFCRADPPLGARVNVVGTVNLFEAARSRRDRIEMIVYASSIAAYDAVEAGGVAEMSAMPGTIYGVYKRANEGTAQVYHQDHGVASVGLRPHTVFGPGRDQGLTSAPTMAMLAAAAGRPYRIGYGGVSQFQYAPDVARAFVQAAFCGHRGATVHNLAGEAVEMDGVVEAITAAAPASRGMIEHADLELPFPGRVDSASLLEVVGAVEETPFDQAVADAISRFRELSSDGRIPPERIEQLLA